MNGIRRGQARSAPPSPARDANRAGDLLNRQFRAAAPNLVWIADFTYCRTWAGFVYVSFIVDVFAQRIVAWHAATHKRTDLVLTPLQIALWDRDRAGHPIQRWTVVAPQRCRQPIYLAAVHRAPRPRRHRPLRRDGRRRLRQRASWKPSSVCSRNDGARVPDPRRSSHRRPDHPGIFRAPPAQCR